MLCHPTAVAAILATILLSACGPSSADAPVAATDGATSDRAAASAVTRIVFIGQDDCCDCTRARIDGSQAALDAALGGLDIPVEHLAMDNPDHRLQVATFKDQQAIVALPAIYLLDARGQLVQMLQGEVAEEQLRAALGPAGRPGAGVGVSGQ